MVSARKGRKENEGLTSHHLTGVPGWEHPEAGSTRSPRQSVVVDCGWGKLLFANTYASTEELVEALGSEDPGQRNVALYVPDPHVVLSLYPQQVFLDPSHTFRLLLQEYKAGSWSLPEGLVIRPALPADLEAIGCLYHARRMVPPRRNFQLAGDEGSGPLVLVAKDWRREELVGVAMGVDHHALFGDPANGSSLWGLAVAPTTTLAGVGEALLRSLIAHYLKAGRTFMDLSVMHDNTQAIALYEKLGFRRVPVYCVKNRNVINEPLFAGPAPAAALGVYSRIIIDEARRRGILVEVVDEVQELVRLSLGGRSVLCRESLCELTSAVAMTICDDKSLTRRLLAAAGLRVPDQMTAGSQRANGAFLKRHGAVVVKPARGEQGRGIAVDLRTLKEVTAAVEAARHVSPQVLLEEYVSGQDLRIVVINGEVVAAAVRRPPEVQGNGSDTVRQLIAKQSRRRAAATHGESRIPLDPETERTVQHQGYGLDDLLPAGATLKVRSTANLHTGGTIHDVTAELHPALAEAAVQAASVIGIPVVGLDFLVPRVNGAEYVIVEANERPGLANHEPQPTAERFLDFLFPQTKALPGGTPAPG